MTFIFDFDAAADFLHRAAIANHQRLVARAAPARSRWRRSRFGLGNDDRRLLYVDFGTRLRSMDVRSTLLRHDCIIAELVERLVPILGAR
jgi:hypothetical protein